MLSLVACIEEVSARDVPARDGDVSGVDHGQEVLHCLVDVLQVARLRVVLHSHFNCGCLRQTSEVVRRLDAFLRLPRGVHSVSEQACRQC